MKTLNKTKGLCLLIAIILIFIPSCEQNNKVSSLGLVASLSGPAAQYGKWAQNGALLSIEDLENKGKKLELFIEDDKTSPKDAVLAFRKLIEINHVPAVIFATATGSVMSSAPIANQKHVVLFTSVASGPNISESGPYVYRNRVNTAYEIQITSRYAIEEEAIKKFVLVALNNDFGISFVKACREIIPKQGGQILTEIYINPGKTDFRAEAAKLLGVEKFDAIYIGATVNESAYFIKQSHEIGIRTQWLGMNAIEDENLLEICGGTVNGLLYSSEAIDPSSENYKHFRKRYIERFGEEPNIYAVNTYDAVMLLGSLILSGADSGEEVRLALSKNVTYKGLSGTFFFDSNGDVVKPLLIKQVKGKAFSNVAFFSADGG